MLDRCETFRDCRTTVPLSSLKTSTLGMLTIYTCTKVCKTPTVKSPLIVQSFEWGEGCGMWFDQLTPPCNSYLGGAFEF